MINCYYENDNVNVYCGVYILVERVIVFYEAVCEIIGEFINVGFIKEVFFIRGMIISLNWVVYFVEEVLIEGD